MSTQGSLFDTTISTVPPGTRTDVCLGCGEALDKGGRQERYCSPACRIWDSKRRRAFESYLAPRPLPEEPEARRDALREVAASNNRYQLVFARWLALRCLWAYGGTLGISSDVRQWADERGYELDWTKPWTGSLFQCPWFEWTGGLRNSYHRGGNARQVKEWRLTDEGRAAYRAARELMG